jgi:hypothetical protein
MFVPVFFVQLYPRLLHMLKCSCAHTLIIIIIITFLSFILANRLKTTQPPGASMRNNSACSVSNVSRGQIISLIMYYYYQFYKLNVQMNLRTDLSVLLGTFI